MKHFSNVPKAEPSLVNGRSKYSDADLTDYYNSGKRLQPISSFGLHLSFNL